MTGINHAVTGAVVAIAVKQPALALPAAFLSHFAIDMLPHWGYDLVKNRQIRSILMFSDILLAAILTVLLAVVLPVSSWLVLAAGFLAVLPDFMWLPYIIWGRESSTDKKTILHAARRFHFKIQWSETRPGALVEAVWLVLMVALLIKIV